ncbi:MAG: glutaminyl-peptide cyclotransferase [Pseudomonadales bacterium]
MYFFIYKMAGLSGKNCLSKGLLLLLIFSGFCLSQESAHNHAEHSFSLEYAGSSPHSPEYFTQGLFFHDGRLYESIGQYGESALIKYQQDNQTPSLQRKLDDRFFAEGATNHLGTIYQLTWRAQIAFAYQGAMLSPSRGFEYSGEGWGLTSDGQFLWLSDGSDKLKRIDESGQVLEEISVHMEGRPLDRLNELEWVNGWILANRWYDPRVYVISPESGEVFHAFDFTALASRELRTNPDNVLNGIAWNPETEQLWITGKNWRRFYQFRLKIPEPTADNTPLN